MTDTSPTVNSLLPPLARAWTYAIGAIVVPLLALLALTFGGAWVTVSLIVSAVYGFAGFGLARANVPVGSPPPDPLGAVVDD